MKYYDTIAGFTNGNNLDRPLGTYQRIVKGIQISNDYLHAGYPILYYDEKLIKDILDISKIGNTWGFVQKNRHIEDFNVSSFDVFERLTMFKQRIDRFGIEYFSELNKKYRLMQSMAKAI